MGAREGGDVKTLVLGLGSEIRRDDAAGLLIAQQLRGMVPHGDVDVIESSVAGWSLLDLLVGYERAIIIDSVCTPERQAGRLHRLSVEDLRQWVGSLSPHRANLVSVLEAGKALGLEIPADIVIYAIEVSDPVGFATEPTAQVQRVLPDIARRIARAEFQKPLPLSPSRRRLRT
jgi:hydrogenase maturation protease